MSCLVKIKNILIRIRQNIDVRIKNSRDSNSCGSDEIVILNTAIGSDNLGDEIIAYYYTNAIKDIVDPKKLYNVATHIKPSDEDVRHLLDAKYAIITGTNILSPQMELYSGWKFDNRLIQMRNVLLVGTGWWGYKKPSIYSKYVYRTILSKEILHSVRDEQTLQMLKSIGINNVVNTNCLTMLGLDKKCKEIPNKKGNEVLFTVTGIIGDQNKDKDMIRIIRKNYTNIYFWPQGDIDLEYLRKIDDLEGIEIVPRSLDAYSEFLQKHDELDYIGTRLHGGIHAMQNGKRAIIVAVDNRAIEMSRDTGLPVIRDTEICDKLDDLINGEWKTEIHLNESAIGKWYKSFTKIASQ